MKLAEKFERIYVINLPYKPDRRERLERHLRILGLAEPEDLTWFRAISGEECWPPAYFSAGGGAWGCLQSHLHIVQNAIMDGLENYLVLEDDAVFLTRSSHLLETFLSDVPDDWGQIYLGGQHLKEPQTIEGSDLVFRCGNVNRTHAFALHRRAMAKFQQHIAHAPEYIQRGGWHIDHQLGLAHERNEWNVYAPSWWVAGQDSGPSNISGRHNPRMWWQPAQYSRELPFIYAPESQQTIFERNLESSVHFGYNLKLGTKQDVGLDNSLKSPEWLTSWLEMIAREAMDQQLLPGIQHPKISIEMVRELWPAGVKSIEETDLETLIDYPFNLLFDHPVTRKKKKRHTKSRRQLK
jgi:GR25 family glycosyltransferase involved in LPS biosynthesis